ncbi:bifunctional 2-polyprenyl-6-hydroxyphenol methylase/3-demethylubiquinol 3-O-methyltransferase UbiG [Stappia sp. ES.058]|uniref:class I SAM-dependent methyltransferase n=1 Tax=Stappia sp. ES.058 TaxID=1881061 RepID=UPI00087A74C4|nr:class I SAM-dependent methyltransferase [Stappia sp. ES.058]SDU18514.1 Methyltransferase domain-containing protein [Stappia sp. ES.058]
MTPKLVMNSYEGKRLLALVRDGDYAHAGGVAGIEVGMADIPKDPKRRILDAGCGRGGTGAYLKAHGWGDVVGFDIEASSIEEATRRFPHISFHACSVEEAVNCLNGSFDLIVLFNVFHALPDQRAGLAALAKLAASSGQIVVFDYVDLGGYWRSPVMENDISFLGTPFVWSDIDRLYSDGGWSIRSARRIDEEYERWYADLVVQIDEKRSQIEDVCGPGWYDHARGLYAGTLETIRNGMVGGVVIHAEREDRPFA